jgi:hypothetical protein
LLVAGIVSGWWYEEKLSSLNQCSGWIHRIHMFLGLLDQDPDPLVRVWIRIRILLSSSKNSKKKLDSYCFVTSFGLFTFEK